jgi:energy-coupling factor transport system permease protein
MIRSEFVKYHPVANLIYFVLCFVSVSFINNPFVIAVLLMISVAHNIQLDKGKKLRSNAVFYIIIGTAMLLANIFFVHRGAVILFYMPGGNPVTLESAVFGIKSGLSLITVLTTFNAFNIVINPEKFMYLFSRVAEQTAFVVMLGLRFVPTLRRRLAEISDISKAAGFNNPVKKQNALIDLKRKISGAMNIITTLIMWSLEDAVVTAQSMRSRGYGVNMQRQNKLKNGRTFYFIYKFSKRDVLFIFFNITSFVLFMSAFIVYKQDVDFQIYPTFSPYNPMTSYKFYINLVFLTVQFALPVFAEIINNIKWSFLYNADNRS